LKKEYIYLDFHIIWNKNYKKLCHCTAK